MTTFGDQVREFGGAPVGSGRFSNPWGTHYFVDSINGKANNSGLRPDDATATIQQAVNLSTNNVNSRGDVIYINPGIWNTGTGFDRYTEDVTITSGVTGTDMTNANMSIIGITGPGATGDFLGVRWKHLTTQNLLNDAPALHVENIGFFSEGATYAVLLRNNGATLTRQGTQGTSFYNCGFKGKGIYGQDGGDGLTVVNSRFQCSYGGAVAQLNWQCSANPGRRLTVRNCEWLDGNGNAPDGPMIHIAAPLTEILIRDCMFPQVPTGNTYITASGACEGLIANVHCASADLTIATHFAVSATLFTTGIYDELGLVVG